MAAADSDPQQHGQRPVTAPGLDPSTNAEPQRSARRVAAAAQRELIAFEVPSWLRTVGFTSWLALGIIAVAAITLLILGLVTAIAIPLAIAAVLAAILVPITDRLNDWLAGHIGLPAAIGSRVLDGTVNAFRGYAKGLTLIGLTNAVVVGVGAWILQLPLVGTIALVTFVTSYVPYLGAFAAGAFAVVIAYGSGGLGAAMAMLVIVLLANNTIQNLLEPVAFGSRLRLHPLVVLITVTTATMLFGILGAMLAAPLTSASVNAYHEVREASASAAAAEVATSPDEPDG